MLRFRALTVYFLLVVAGCAPVWSVEYFIQQDGSAHVYNAYLMGQIVRDSASVHYVALNSIAVPNSSGHWLLACMLQFVGGFTATKMIATLVFAGFTAVGGYLSRKTSVNGCVELGFLIGAVLAFNWLWLAGFYNFTLGVVCFVFTTGLYYGWRGRITPVRVAILAVCLLVCYWSHIVSFGMLAGTIFAIALFGGAADRRTTLVRTALSVVPVVPLFFLFRSVSVGAEPFEPHWRSLTGTEWLRDWGVQILSADPFVLISRKTFPFTDAHSTLLFLAAPIIWMIVGCVLLLIQSYFSRSEGGFRSRDYLFAFLFAGGLIVALFGPDDFGLTSGSILRERILISTLFLLIPLLAAVRPRSLLGIAGIACLILVFLFQTASLFEYAIRTNAEATEFIAVKDHIPEGSAVASIVSVRSLPRFHSIPMPQMNSYNGVDRDIRIWDNYELGHRLFPVVVRSEDDRAFIHELTQVSALYLYDSPDLDQRLTRLRKCLEQDHSKIDIVVVWDLEPRIAELLEPWFEPEAYFTSGRAQLFRHL